MATMRSSRTSRSPVMIASVSDTVMIVPPLMRTDPFIVRCRKFDRRMGRADYARAKLDCKDTTQPPAPAHTTTAARTLAAETADRFFDLFLARRGRIGLGVSFRVRLRFFGLRHRDAVRDAHFVFDAPPECR